VKSLRPFLLTRILLVLLLSGIPLVRCESSFAATNSPKEDRGPQKIILDTDIGTDIDDAFAVGLILQSSEFKVLGMCSASGDTMLRARLLSRMLKDTGHGDIPVAMGIPFPDAEHRAPFSQAPYAEGGPKNPTYPNAVDFILDQIKRQPGEITLIAIGPLTNLGAAIDKDPATFHQVKRVIIMGGSIYRGYESDGAGVPAASAEYNIVVDIKAAQKVFGAGVPLYVMPLDSTIIPLQEVRRAKFVSAGTPITDAITLMYCQWSPGCNGTPTLFDPVAVTYAIRPDLCPTTPLRVRVDDKGLTRVQPGEPDVQVCLKSDPEKLLDFMIPRIMAREPSPPTK
jgi:inosine-uridine nucleoside N-ribohydrolase